MPFEESQTLSNQDSKVRIDVESLARMEISDIDFILEAAQSSNGRSKKILYEAALTKCATAWQLAMRAWEYLEQHDKKKNQIDRYSKDSAEGIGLIGRLRGDLFHSGVSFYERTTFYPFGQVRGRGYVAMRVRKNGCLSIRGYANLTSKDSEFAITSEGIYEIKSPDTKEEKWIRRDDLLTINASDDTKVEEVIRNGLADLQSIWNEIKSYRLTSESHEITFLNEDGAWEILEEKEGEISKYESTTQSLDIKGSLSFSPPKSVEIRPSEGTITYKC